jgi:hemerythrin-like domain-containing protein
MKETTKMLVNEHKNILKVVDALVKECDAIDSGKKIDKDFLQKIINFIRNYADKLHHSKEENILFKEFYKSQNIIYNPEKPKPYEREHEQGRNFVKKMMEGLEKDNKKEIIENARAYAKLIRQHISKEDNALFPTIEKALGDRESEMIREFRKVDNDKKEEIERQIKFVKSIN